VKNSLWTYVEVKSKPVARISEALTPC